MRTRVYLDFDGVINVFRMPKSPPWKESTGWEKHRKDRLISDYQKYVIHYAPELVEEINKLDDEGVEVIWCSTWLADTKLFTKLGFKVFPYLDFVPGYRQRFWETKGRAVREHMRQHPVDQACWYDDDLDTISIAAFDLDNLYTEHVDKLTGLTPEHIARLRTKLGLGA